MAQSANWKPRPAALTLGGMTARWSDPHRLPGSPASCDPGYVRAVNPARVKRVIARANAILRPPITTVRSGDTVRVT